MKTKFFNKILNLIFPEKLKCMLCGEDVKDFDNDPICDDCKREEIFNNSQIRCKICDQPFYGEGNYCENCKTHQKSFDKATSPFIYTGKIRSAILKFKSNNARYLAYPMAKLMAKRLENENMLDFDLIIPVPMSEKSFKKRGYNQALLLANELGKILNKPVIDDLLLKVKETKHQKDLNFLSRQENLSSAFELRDKQEIKGKSILIVDDILTTCATVNSCSNTMSKYVQKIYIVTFARNLPKTK